MKYIYIFLILCTFIPLSEARELKTYIEIGGGVNTNITGSSMPWEDRNSLGCMFGTGLLYNINKSSEIDFAYRHYSQCFIGPPFNTDSESSLDSFYITYRYYINPG
jgi:hypothetical protein